MKTLLALLTLAAVGCAPETDAVEPDNLVNVAGQPATEAVCGSPNYDYVVSNNGAAINENSYKTRALRTFVNLGVCSGTHNKYTCGADVCTATSTSTSPYGVQVKNCFDLPSCAAWECRSCQLQFKQTPSSAWASGFNATDLHYQQGYGVAKFQIHSDHSTFATSLLQASPASIHYGD